MPVDFSKENRVHLVVSRFKASVLMETVDWAGNYLYVLLSSTDFCSLRK